MSGPTEGPPCVIAHRGASGYLPEHTREAKMLAYGQGADYLEQDVVATADEHLVVLHDICLDDVTDVARRFPQRRRGDGRFYVVDFTLDELKELRVIERRQEGTDQRVFPGRFPDDEVDFRIVTFDEELRLVRALNATTGRAVGVYPEIKDPAFHHGHGIDLAARLLDALRRFGYSRQEDPAVVQCFDANELERCRYQLGTRPRGVCSRDRRRGSHA
jgi:glycerophosphoryl diester phosphodiesterase